MQGFRIIKKKLNWKILTIKLDVQEYCHGCANFTADVKEPEKYYAGFDIIEMTDTLVRCEHRKLCENLVRYLRKQVDLDGKSENQ